MTWKEVVSWIAVGAFLIGLTGAMGYYFGHENYSKDDKAGEIIYFYKSTGERYKALYQAQCAETEYANRRWYKANELMIKLLIENGRLKNLNK